MALIFNDAVMTDMTFQDVPMKTITFNDNLIWTRIDAPTIVTDPIGASIDETQSHPMTMVATDGDGTLAYQWYLNTGTPVGANLPSYTHQPSPEGSYSYDCVATNERGSARTAAAVVTVVPSWDNTLTNADVAGQFRGFNTGAGAGGSMVPVNTGDGHEWGRLMGSQFQVGWGIRGQASDGMTITVNVEGFGTVTSPPLVWNGASGMSEVYSDDDSLGQFIYNKGVGGGATTRLDSNLN